MQGQIGAGLQQIQVFLEPGEFAGRGEFDFEVRLILKKEQVPACVLGGDQLLGWTSWATTQPKLTDAGDTILTI